MSIKCDHISEFKKINGLQTYKTVHSFFVARRKKYKLNYNQVLATCFDCEKFNNVSRLFACLHCVYMGCFEKHATPHSSENDHILSVELSNGNVYCYSCGDYVYDRDFEIVTAKHKRGIVYTLQSPMPKPPLWSPSNTENKLLLEHPKRIKLEAHSIIGIRGMVNFGGSCYLNCIMQALFHTPMLRDYFFTDKHKCSTAKNGDCFYCPVSRLFQEYYSDETSSSVTPHEIYYYIWRSDENLAGSEQKDAQEWFTTFINLLHKYSSPSNSSIEGIVDLIFHGKLQSDVICKSCGNISTTVEPFWDISLDIPDLPAKIDLFECLKHFTKAESLVEKIECNTCQSNEYGTKQLTFRVLPLVIVIHFKRFEHVHEKCRVKISVPISFPLELDMTPFVSGYRNKRNSKHDAPPKKRDDVYDNTYTLYAVIEHTGEISSGHYVAYIRHTRHTWFRCNDADVVPASVEEVMSKEGYILFYHKTVLHYK